MRIEVDREANAAYVTIEEGRVSQTHRLDSDRLLDVDEAGRVVGIELLNVSQGVNLKDLPHGEELARILGRHNILVHA